MIRVAQVSVLAWPLVISCSGSSKPAVSTVATGGDAAPSAAPAADATPALSDPFAALLDERARALVATAGPQLASLGPNPQRTAVIVRVIWSAVASDPVYRIEAMAFLLPDGRLRWGVLGQVKAAGALEVASGLAYPEGVLAEGLRRPLVAGEGDCDLPMIPLVDVATLPQVAREDTFLHGYGKADACQIAADGVGSAWVASLDWFGVILRGAGPDQLFVTAPAKVDRATITFEGAATANPMPMGDRVLIVDGVGGPRCDAGSDCFDIGERAALTGERFLTVTGYGKACDLGHGLSCIHVASFEADAAKADTLRTRAVTAFRAGCGRNDALDCAYLGIALETGQGAAKDEKAAVAAYQQACTGRSPLGCFNLGGMHREGRGTRKDAAAARKAYQQACDLGDAGGCDAVESMKP